MFVAEQMSMIDHSNFEPAVAATVVAKPSYKRYNMMQSTIHELNI